LIYMRKLLSLAFSIAALIAMPRSAHARVSSGCLPSDSLTTFIQTELVRLVTSTDTAAVRVRNSVNLPGLSASDVQVVSDSTVCTTLANALAAITLNGDANPGAWVFRMGPTRFVAFNGRQNVHGSAYAYVYDDTFVRLASFPF